MRAPVFDADARACGRVTDDSVSAMSSSMAISRKRWPVCIRRRAAASKIDRAPSRVAWTIVVGAIMWAGKTQALPAKLIEAKVTAHLSDTRIVGIKPVKICNLHNVKKISFGLLACFGPLGGPNFCDWNIAGLQDKIIFGSNHIADFCSLPFCQGKRINYLVRLGSI
jgi:hypothetical protein